MSQISPQQQHIISSLSLTLSINSLMDLLNNAQPSSWSDDALVAILEATNACYRAGYPLVDDAFYDHHLLSALQDRQPDHPFLLKVEPEVISGKTVTLPQKMLSTDKAYSIAEIEKWVTRIKKAADELNIAHSEVYIRITPKLDGYAAFDDGKTLYTRGDGVRGQDITRAFTRGLAVANQGERGLGPGEIVISKQYFNAHLAEQFENSRNIQAAIIAEKNIEPSVVKAIADEACVFYPFALLPHWTGLIDVLAQDIEAQIEPIWQAVDYDIDGVILETTHSEIKNHMGATRHHHRWQIAFKVNDESAEVEVLNVTPQTSRTGRVSPVAELVPTKLSGATISRATVHHYKMVQTNGVGPGAIVQLVRSGLVIPKIEKVITSVTPQLPETCPSCHSHVIWEADHLICPNKSDCPAQRENTLVHFFKTLGNNDGFGPKVVEKLCQNGVQHIHDIYAIEPSELIGWGFGEKTAFNLIEQLNVSRTIAIEDWRFLAAFGVTRLGGGNGEKLLQHHTLPDLFDLTVDAMVEIDGFAQLSAEAIVEGLANVKDEFFKVYQLGFNLIPTPKLADSDLADSVLFGQQIVFTGSMTSGSRSEMEKHAKSLGAKVGKSVSGNTTYLITGEKVGANKINAAKDKGVTVLTESEYLAMIS
ncbi:MAG: DNA ligase [Glaciecola sp. HTCC2999]|nr:MAG: DNA ligase [Glaciecola sp. HTCC2999]